MAIQSLVEPAEILAVPFFVVGEEFVPAVLDELPEDRCARAAGLVDVPQGGATGAVLEFRIC